jgi:hypothetical protein
MGIVPDPVRTPKPDSYESPSASYPMGQNRASVAVRVERQRTPDAAAWIGQSRISLALNPGYACRSQSAPSTKRFIRSPEILRESYRENHIRHAFSQSQVQSRRMTSGRGCANKQTKCRAPRIRSAVEPPFRKLHERSAGLFKEELGRKCRGRTELILSCVFRRYYPRGARGMRGFTLY